MACCVATASAARLPLNDGLQITAFLTEPHMLIQILLRILRKRVDLGLHAHTPQLTGSVHASARRHPAVAAASAAVGLLSAVVKHSMADMVEPARNILTVRLPRQGQCAVCALQLAPGGPVGAAAPYGTSPTNEAHIVGSSSGLPSDSVVLVAASADGLLYEYLIEELRSADGPKCSLEKQWNMLGSGGSSGGR